MMYNWRGMLTYPPPPYCPSQEEVFEKPKPKPAAKKPAAATTPVAGAKPAAKKSPAKKAAVAPDSSDEEDDTPLSKRTK